MDFVEFEVTKNDTGRRIDKIVSLLLPDIPYSLICKNIRSGFIRLNGKKTQVGVKVALHDKIGIEKYFFTRSKTDNKPSSSVNTDTSLLENITILKNEHILILNKPYGFLSQSANNSETSLDKIVQAEFCKTHNSLFKVGALHRLDKSTSGILCFSQSLQGAQWFSSKMQNHEIKKTYIAIVEGKLRQKKEWRDYLEKSQEKAKNGFYLSKISDVQNGRLATTIASPISASEKNFSLVNFEIPTGLNHQIRLQSSYHGFPLLNDKVYGAQKVYSELGQYLYLHCQKMIFPQNDLGIPQEITAPLPAEFEQAMEFCGLK